MKSADCGGGWATAAWGWMRTNGGLATESALPYLAGSGTYGDTYFGSGVATCTSPPTAAGSTPIAWTNVTPKNDIGLAAALLNRPVKVSPTHTAV